MTACNPGSDGPALYDKQPAVPPLMPSSSPGILLLTGSELATARSWADAHPDEALDFEKQFLVASTEREEARTQSRQLIAMIGVLVAMVLLGSMLLLRSNSRANEERIKTRRAQVMSSLTRGLDLCQYDNKTAEGLHWLVRGLEQADQVIELRAADPRGDQCLVVGAPEAEGDLIPRRHRRRRGVEPGRQDDLDWQRGHDGKALGCKDRAAEGRASQTRRARRGRGV